MPMAVRRAAGTWCFRLRLQLLAWNSRVGAARVPMLVASALLAATITSAPAAELTVTVVDRLNRPVADVVVTAMPTTPISASPSAPVSAIMDQRDLQFAPLVLAVAVGTSVDFPNSDTVSHQVYSFSPARKFQLPLYKGAHHPPVVFDKPGLVVLGCNIHDDMVGYIFVTDAPSFGTTDAQGLLHFDNLHAGDYTVRLWSPFITDAVELLHREVRIDPRQPNSMQWHLSRDLRARPEPRAKRGSWEY
jgi:plastocyanin